MKTEQHRPRERELEKLSARVQIHTPHCVLSGRLCCREAQETVRLEHRGLLVSEWGKYYCDHVTVQIMTIYKGRNTRVKHQSTGWGYILALLSTEKLFFLCFSTSKPWMLLQAFIVPPGPTFLFAHLLTDSYVSFSNVHFSQTLRPFYENERTFFILSDVHTAITSENNFLRDVLGVVFRNILSSRSSPW